MKNFIKKYPKRIFISALVVLLIAIVGTVNNYRTYRTSGIDEKLYNLLVDAYGTAEIEVKKRGEVYAIFDELNRYEVYPDYVTVHKNLTRVDFELNDDKFSADDTLMCTVTNINYNYVEVYLNQYKVQINYDGKWYTLRPGYFEEGEVCVTGPSMMKCYFNSPEETENIMRKHDDGQIWIHSGDVGYMDDDGFLYIKGRIKRMITRFDGHKVFPINLESVVVAYSGVRNCAVVGVDDLEHSQGQYPLVLVEVMPDVDSNQICKEIFEFCNTGVEERGKPVAVVALDEIPLTGMGKYDYRLLEERFKDFDYKSWNLNL